VSSTTQPSSSFAPQLRPLGVGEVLDASFKIVRQSFGTLAACVLVVALPLNILNTLIAASTRDDAFDIDNESTSTVSTGTELAGSLLTTTLGLVLTTLAAAACFRAVSGVYLGERPTVGASLSFAASRLLPVIALSFLYFLGLVPAFIALIIPGVWLSVAWSLSFPALLSEGIGPIKALGRSFRLVKGRWWPTFGALLVMYLIVVVISGILGALFGATLFAATDNEPVAAVLYTIVNTLSSLITLPLFAAVLTVLYFDLRVRKEGFDLQLLARGVGREAEPGDTSPQAVRAASGLGEPASGGFAPPAAPAQGGGWAPPQAPDRPEGAAAPWQASDRPEGAAAPPHVPERTEGDPLAPSEAPDRPAGDAAAPTQAWDRPTGDAAPPQAPERREGDGGAAS